MRPRYIVAAISVIVAISIVSLALAAVVRAMASQDQKTINATVRVVSSTAAVSISVDRTSIVFPDVLPGSTTSATFQMTNNSQVPVNAFLSFNPLPPGNVGYWFSPHWPGPIPAGATVTWEVTLTVSPNAAPGEYSFTITVTAVAAQ